jgi:hypothetical protein
VLPFALRQNAWFEWANPLWLLETQAEWVRSNGVPAPYLHAPDQVFYPFHLFYAEGLLGVLAYPAIVVGAWPVFLAVTVAAFVVAQQSVAWLARSLGAGDGLARLLGLGFVTTPYVVALLYGRGAWTELVAVAGVTLAIAGSAELLTAAEPRGRATAAVVAGVATVVATHNLTLLFGLPLAGAILLVALWARHDRPATSAVSKLAVAAVAGGCLFAVALVPNVWLSRDTLIAQPEVTHRFFDSLGDFHSVAMVLSPLPAVPASQPAGSVVYIQTAVPLLLWLVVALAALYRRRRPSPAALALAALGIALLVAIVNPRWWLHLPATLQTIQFPFRLVTWLTLAIVVACALVLRGAERRTRWLAPSLAGAIAVQSAIALWIAFGADASALPDVEPLRHGDISAGVVPRSFVGTGYGQPKQFRLPGSAVRPAEQVLAPQRLIDPPPRITLRGEQPARTLLATNVVDSPLIRYDGTARKVGRDKDGFAVLEVLPHAGPAWSVTISARAPLPVWAGRTLSALSVLAVLGWALAALRSRRIAPG